MKHQGIPFRKVLRATNKCTTLLEIKVKWYLTPIHWAGCRSLVVRTSYQWEGTLAFESRDMAWPIRGQINPCHLTSLTISAHLASPWQNFSRTWHNMIIIVSNNKIFIIHQNVLIFSPWRCPGPGNHGQSHPVVGCSSQSGGGSKNVKTELLLTLFYYFRNRLGCQRHNFGMC